MIKKNHSLHKKKYRVYAKVWHKGGVCSKNWTKAYDLNGETMLGGDTQLN